MMWVIEFVECSSLATILIFIFFYYLSFMFLLLVSVPLWLLCGSQLECPGVCEQSLHGDAFYSGKYIKSII